MARRADALLVASPFPDPLRVEGARLSAKAQWEQGGSVALKVRTRG
jgi:hypothetical protein